MEVKIQYKAKDGRVFYDPYLCESYEKSLEKGPGTLGRFLNLLKGYKESDYFIGIIYYRENNDVKTLSVYTMDFSDLYEGEYVTQAMQDAQKRVTVTVGNVLDFFKDIDNSIPCCGSFIISPTMDMKESTIAHIGDQGGVFKQ